MAGYLSWASQPRLAVHNIQPRTASFVSMLTLLLSSSWRHYDTYKRPNPLQQEVWIEWLSWVIIIVYQRAFSNTIRSLTPVDTSLSPQGFWSTRKAVWITGVLAASSQLLAGQKNLTWALPLTTVAITVTSHVFSVRKNVGSNVEEKASMLELPDGASSTAGGMRETTGSPSSIILNLICWALLFNYKEALTTNSVLIGSALFLVLRTTAIHYISRLERTTEIDADEGELSTAEVVSMLSQPVIALLTVVLVVVRPDLEMSSIGVILHALAQAASWLAMITLIRSDLTNTVANLDTISLSLEMALTDNALGFVAAAVGALLVSATQSVLVLRPSASVRQAIYGFVLVLTVGVWIRHDPRLTTGIAAASNGVFSSGHPIENLIAANRLRFSAMLARQSQTLEQAVVEYKRRYGRKPPLGFDEWFELARDNQFVLMDEFDTLMHALEPFHGIHPNVLQQRLDKVLEVAGGQMVTYKITNGQVSMSENLGDITERLTNTTWLNIVPYNMTLAVNGFDEAMVSAPWEEVRKAMEDSKMEDKFAKHQVQANLSPLLQIGGQSAWSATAQACSIYSPARQIECPAASRKVTEPLRFIQNATLSKDVCQNCELLQQEGFLMGPDTLNIATQLTPVWSASKPSHFHDMLYPSSYYIQVRDDYKAKEDIPWEEKDNVFYWVGTATGGRITESNWNLMQRQRLVLRTQKGSTDAIQLLEETGNNSGIWRPRYTTMAEISDLFSTRISKVVQCTDAACVLEKEAFGIGSEEKSDEKSSSYTHRFALDIDGNTFSGRFYRLLQSRSMVIRQTTFKEWHDDRLIPWVHYAPLSTSFEELPEMARYFATTERGQALAKRIAEESTVWHNKALRDVDIRLVWLRMLLEYGRLMNPALT